MVPTVMTAQGAVVGVDQGATHAWYAIPYAAPPIGPLRFRRPAPPPRHREPLHATGWGPAPVQRFIDGSVSGYGRTAVSEDCLTLNIVRPADAPSGPLPVFVWVHGGAFITGAASTYDARRLAAAGRMVVVTLNYRVGPFGFLDLSSLPSAPRGSDGDTRFQSNAGLFDQIAALDWVRRNIASFGGDPSTITLAGQSAGGTSVLALMCMPAARGLFARAIAQSPAPAMGLPASVHARWAARFARLLGGGAGAVSPAEAVAAAAPGRILEAMDELHGLAAAECPDVSILSPCIDTSLPEPIMDAFAAGRQASVPLLIGTNRDEDGLAPSPWGETADAELRAWYATVERTAEAHSNRAPTWMYRFDHVSADLRIGPRGATHSQELRYLFGNLPDDAPARDARFSERMQGLWSQFAAEGKPADPTVWPRHNVDHRVMILDDAPELERRSCNTGSVVHNLEHGAGGGLSSSAGDPSGPV